jgi:hypothetical protein
MCGECLYQAKYRVMRWVSHCGCRPLSLTPQVLSVVAATGRRLGLTLSLGCDVARVSSRVSAGSRWPGVARWLSGQRGGPQPGTASARSRRTPSLRRSAHGGFGREVEADLPADVCDCRREGEQA